MYFVDCSFGRPEIYARTGLAIENIHSVLRSDASEDYQNPLSPLFMHVNKGKINWCAKCAKTVLTCRNPIGAGISMRRNVVVERYP
jgi:hypothetical protein